MKFTLEQFEGPLDLLLSLIQEEKLDISEVALSKVTEQYVASVEAAQTIRPDELADFLLIATRLLLMKARKLIPDITPEEADGPSLADQLRLYQQFVQASKAFTSRWMSGQRAVFRISPPRRPARFVAPKQLVLATVHGAMVQLVNRLTPPKPLPRLTIDHGVSVRDKIAQIRQLLLRGERFSFADVVRARANRTEVIVSFLALLELMRDQFVHLRQEQTFGNILITVK